MTDWFSITEAMTDPGAPGTSELWKSWWKNPIAIAEGAPGAPRVDGRALGQISMGAITVTGATGNGYIGCDRYGMVLGHIVTKNFSGSVYSMRARYSSNNGGSFGAWQTLFDTVSALAGISAYSLRLNLQTGVWQVLGTDIDEALSQGGTHSVPVNCNAFQISYNSGNQTGAADFLSLGGLE